MKNSLDSLQARIKEDSATGCWNWTGMRGGNGYGRVQLSRGHHTSAHRYFWKLFGGTIPEGLLVCHHCDNRLCVNPNHLFLGTVQDNTDDMMRKGRGVVPVGEASGKSVLTDELVRRIRQQHQDGTTQTAIAKEHGVSVANINYIVRRKTWSHI